MSGALTLHNGSLIEAIGGLGRKALSDPRNILSSAVGWWDVASHVGGQQVLPNRGTGGSALDAQFGSTTGTDTNDPQVLPFDGRPYVALPGVAGNYLSVPDEAALRITGDLEIVCRVMLTDWTPTGDAALIGKYVSSGGGRSYLLYLTAAGTLSLYWSADGTNMTVKGVNATGPVDGQAYWLKVTLDVDNGAGGSSAAFYWASDQPTEPSAWTQLGTTQVGAGVTSLFANTQAVHIGQQSGLNPVGGNVYRAIIRNGINGTTVLDVDTSVLTSGSATSFTALTGQTVTINRSATGRKAVAVVRPTILFGTDDYLTVPDNNLLDFNTGEDLTVVAAWRAWGTFVPSGSVIAKTQGSNTWELRNGFGTPAQIIGAMVDPGGSVGVAASTFKTPGSTIVVAFARSGSAVAIRGSNGNGDGVIAGTGDLRNTGALRIGSGTGSFNDMEFVGAAVFRRALSATEIQAITAYYQQRMP